MLPAKVNVSVLESAAIVVDPTTTLENAFWFTSAPVAIPSSFFLSAADSNPFVDWVATPYVVLLSVNSIVVLPLWFIVNVPLLVPACLIVTVPLPTVGIVGLFVKSL